MCLVVLSLEYHTLKIIIEFNLLGVLLFNPILGFSSQRSSFPLALS
jgi:hypothetical protein